jgi:hypothetical protein
MASATSRSAEVGDDDPTARTGSAEQVTGPGRRLRIGTELGPIGPHGLELSDVVSGEQCGLGDVGPDRTRVVQREQQRVGAGEGDRQSGVREADRQPGDDGAGVTDRGLA